MHLTHTHRRPAAGFTLMELMVVIAIMALLASLTLMGFRYAQITAMRNRTTAFHRAIMSGLENYHSEFGEYPRPKNEAQSSKFGSNTYTVGSALMLYQAMSGDGDNQIDINGASKPSDGKIIGEEVGHVMIKEMPTEMWKHDPSSGWILVDGFSHPFQYAAPNPLKKARYGESSDMANRETVNNTYDLWSYGEDDTQTSQISYEARRGDKSVKWIKNW